MRISLVISPRGPLPTPASAAARHWYSVDNQLSPLLVGAMSSLYSSLFKAPSGNIAAFPRAFASRAIQANRGILPRYYTAGTNMSDLFVELTAPNGHKYKQPRGLFINNEFVKSKSGETISSINPRYIGASLFSSTRLTDTVTRKRSSQSTQLVKKMSTTQ